MDLMSFMFYLFIILSFLSKCSNEESMYIKMKRLAFSPSEKRCMNEK